MDTTWDVFSHGKTEHGKHVCYWCAKVGAYPPMPIGYTLCVRCGTFMHTGQDDPMNDHMEVCILCRQEMRLEE